MHTILTKTLYMNIASCTNCQNTYSQQTLYTTTSLQQQFKKDVQMLLMLIKKTSLSSNNDLQKKFTK